MPVDCHHAARNTSPKGIVIASLSEAIHNERFKANENSQARLCRAMQSIVRRHCEPKAWQSTMNASEENSPYGFDKHNHYA